MSNQTKLSLEDYLQSQDWVANYLHDMPLGLDTEQAFEAIVDEATREGIILSDVDTVDYDKLLNEMYYETKNAQ